MSTQTPSGPPPPSVPPSAPLPSVSRLSLASAEGGGGNLLFKLVPAAVIVVLAIGAYFYFGEKPAVATGEVTHVTAYPIHRVANSALAANLRAARVENTFDQVIVVVQVRLRNQSQLPLFLSDVSALLTLPNEEDRSTAANASDYNRVFVAYPELLPMKQQPLLRDTTIAAGQMAEGQLVFNYPITKEQWDQRRALDLTLSFLHQKDLVINAPQ